MDEVIYMMFLFISSFFFLHIVLLGLRVLSLLSAWKSQMLVFVGKKENH